MIKARKISIIRGHYRETTQYKIPRFDKLSHEIYEFGIWLASQHSKVLVDSLLKRVEIWIEKGTKGEFKDTTYDDRYEIYSRFSHFFEAERKIQRDASWTEEEFKDSLVKCIEFTTRDKSKGYCPTFHLRDLVDFIANLSRLSPETLLRTFWEFRDSSLVRDHEIWSHQLNIIISNDFIDETFKAFEITEYLLKIDNTLECRKILWDAWLIQTGVFSPLEDGTAPKIKRTLDYIDKVKIKVANYNFMDFWNELKNRASKEKNRDILERQKLIEQLEEGDHGYLSN